MVWVRKMVKLNLLQEDYSGLDIRRLEVKVEQLTAQMKRERLQIHKIYNAVRKFRGPRLELNAILDRVTEAAISDDQDLIFRMTNISGDLTVTGACSHCGISTFAGNIPDNMPCEVQGCPYEGGTADDRETRNNGVSKLIYKD